jgi:hypothetical protein
MNPRTLELAACLAHLCNFEPSEAPDVATFDPSHLERLTDEFYAWSDGLIDPMISAGLGDLSIDDLWPNAEFVWLCERLGHGVSFTDSYGIEAAERPIAELASQLARSQAYIQDGAYIGDDGRAYLYNYHAAEAKP